MRFERKSVHLDTVSRQIFGDIQDNKFELLKSQAQSNFERKSVHLDTVSRQIFGDIQDNKFSGGKIEVHVRKMPFQVALSVMCKNVWYHLLFPREAGTSRDLIWTKNELPAQFLVWSAGTCQRSLNSSLSRLSSSSCVGVVCVCFLLVHPPSSGPYAFLGPPNKKILTFGEFNSCKLGVFRF